MKWPDFQTGSSMHNACWAIRCPIWTCSSVLSIFCNDISNVVELAGFLISELCIMNIVLFLELIPMDLVLLILIFSWKCCQLVRHLLGRESAVCGCFGKERRKHASLSYSSKYVKIAAIVCYATFCLSVKWHLPEKIFSGECVSTPEFSTKLHETSC